MIEKGTYYSVPDQPSNEYDPLDGAREGLQLVFCAVTRPCSLPTITGPGILDFECVTFVQVSRVPEEEERRNQAERV